MSVWSTAISKMAYSLVGFLYVDNMDLVAINSGNKSVDEIVARAQLLVDQWQYALQLTGVDLKQRKYF